jgi:hypothetical protein
MKQMLLFVVLLASTSSHALGACGSYLYPGQTRQPGFRECRFGNLFVCQCGGPGIYRGSERECEFKYRGNCEASAQPRQQECHLGCAQVNVFNPSLCFRYSTVCN